MKNADEPAFKRLTKREYFAGLAMQGVCAHPGTGGKSGEIEPAIAKRAVKLADAILEELEKPHEL